MRTNLNRQILSIEDAKSYLRELATNGEAYHPDDSADSIEWHENAPDANECIKMDGLMDACRDFLDPCEELLALAHAEKKYIFGAGLKISGYDAYFIEDVDANGIDIHEYLNTSEIGDRFLGMSNELRRIK